MAELSRLQVKISSEDEAWGSVGFGTSDYKVPVITYANTAKDGSGTDYVPLVDSDGHLQVDVLAGGGGYQYAEDSVHSSGHYGNIALSVRNDVLASLVTGDGDYAPLQVNSLGALYTTPGNFVSTNNSSTSALGVSAVFTGTGDDCLNYSSISITIDASHDSATDGVSIQFSSDNTNWDTVRTYTFDVSVTPQLSIIVPVEARYFRIVYTNGGTLQTHFRLQTILHSNPTLQISRRLSDSESPELTGQLGKNVVLAQSAGTGLFIPIQATATGNIKMSLQEASDGMDIGAGNAGTETLRVSIATDDVNLSAIKTAVEILDNAISGNEMQVDLVGAIPTGANVIGKVRLVTATGDEITEDTDNSMQVTIVADDVGVGGGTEYTEDVATANPQVGKAIMMERDDALSTVTPVEGDWIGLRGTAEGALWVQDFNSDAILADTAAMVVDLAAIEVLLGTIDADTGAIKTAVELLDDAVDGNYLNVNANIAGTDIVGGAGAVAAGVQRMTLASDDPAVVDLAAIEVLLTGIDADTNTIQGDTTSIDGKITACNTGAVVLSSGTVTTVTTLTGAGVAHNAVDSGNPHKIGGRAQDIIGAEPEEVADNDRVDALFDQNGRMGVTAGSDYKYADINDAVSGNNTIVAAQAAGKRIAVWAILIVSDGTTDVRWEDGAGGTAFTGQVPLQAREGYSISAGGLVPLFVGSAATLLNLELTAAINVHGFVSYTVLED